MEYLYIYIYIYITYDMYKCICIYIYMQPPQHLPFVQQICSWMPCVPSYLITHCSWTHPAHMYLQHSAVTSIFDIFISLYLMFCLMFSDIFNISKTNFKSMIWFLQVCFFNIFYNIWYFYITFRICSNMIRGIDGLKLCYLFLQQSRAYFLFLLMNTTLCKVVVYNDYWWNSCLLNFL